MNAHSPPPESPSSGSSSSGSPPPELYDDLCFNDDALTALDKIYLFSRSSALLHRVFIARALPAFLADVAPADALDYVLPLLNGLATDHDAVKEALVTTLVPVMWWFFENCLLVEHDPLDAPHDPPRLPVQTFTPILGSLLIDSNPMVCGPARFAVVESLNRLRVPARLDSHFGPEQRILLENELVYQVIIGMARLDCSPESHPPVGDPASASTPTPTPESEPAPAAPVRAPDDAAEQAAVGRCSSMSLIATVTANATLPEDTARAFSREVARIGSDHLYWVRREAAFALGALAKVVPPDLLHLSLLPLFHDLACDPVSHVRHSALFALPGILARLPPPHRRALALDSLRPLARDMSPTVRSAVLEVLGEVIYTFRDDHPGPPAELVALFVAGIQPHPQKPIGSLQSAFDTDEDDSPPDSLAARDDPARALITSFNYPAVALSLGPERWEEVRGYYIALARTRNFRVRRTIASGLGEIARILGGAIAARDLLGIWDALVHDPDDAETRLRALRGLEMLARALQGAARRHVVGALDDLWARWLAGWRERERVACALPALASLAAGQEETVRTLLRRALVDPVAAVREAGIAAVWPVLRTFRDRPHAADAVRGDVGALACAEAARGRATYVSCYCALVEGGATDDGAADEVARDEFWEGVVLLSGDAIVDVRIGVARLLRAICDRFYAAPPARAAAVVRQLAQDAAPDVRAFVAGVLVRGGAAVPVRAGTPPGSFAVFARPPPPPAPPPPPPPPPPLPRTLGAVTARLGELGIAEEMQDAGQVRGPQGGGPVQEVAVDSGRAPPHKPLARWPERWDECWP